MQHYNLQGQWNFNDLSKVEVTSKELEDYELEAGDILFNTRNSYELVGKVAIWPSNVNGYVYNNNLMRMRFAGNILPQWIAFQMIAPEFRKSLELVKSATTSVCAIYGKDLFQQNILLAPLNEQRRIVSTIEQLTDRSHKARAALEDVPKLIAQFRQSVLAAAFRGDLTADWREKNPDVEPASELLERIKIDRRKRWEEAELEKMKAKGKEPNDTKWKEKYIEPDTIIESDFPALASNWRWVRSEQVCEFITKGTTPKSEEMTEDTGEIPFIKVYNLTFSGDLDFSVNPTFISKETHNITLARSRVFPGNVLMNIVGPPLGKVSIVPDSHPEWNMNQAIAVYAPIEGLYNKFLCYYLLSNECLSFATRMAKATAGQFNLTLEICRNLPLPLPSLTEQYKIVEIIESSFKFIQLINEQVEYSLSQQDRLDRSILAKAFRGELVPQDPNDEPAAILLDRIRAERDRTSTPKQRGKTTRKNSSKQLSIDLE
jgi:type I restriction enzyme, S subunit